MINRFGFDFEEANKKRKERIKAICDYYQISTFWAQDMWIPEIEYFERLIEEDKKSKKDIHDIGK